MCALKMYVTSKRITAGLLPSFLFHESDQQATDEQIPFLFLKILDGMLGTQGNDGRVSVCSLMCAVRECMHVYTVQWKWRLCPCPAVKLVLCCVILQGFEMYYTCCHSISPPYPYLSFYLFIYLLAPAFC